MNSNEICVVIRFTRDEVLSLRKKTKVLQDMVQYSDIVSVAPLDPASLHPITSEEVRLLLLFVINMFLIFYIIGAKIMECS